MNENLKRYDLDFDRTYSYFISQIEDGNTLSKVIISQIDFNEGVFTTYLPEKDIDIDNLYTFKVSIIPPGPPTVVTLEGKKYHAVEVTSLKKELAEFLFGEIKEKKCKCIFEECQATREDRPATRKKDFFLSLGMEVYYAFSSDNNSLKNIRSSITYTDVHWHSLCVLFDVNVELGPEKLTHEMINSICQSVKTIIVGAYDGEAYLFWNKK